MECPFCQGNKRCKKCNGTGHVLKGLFSKKEKPCDVCNGNGMCKMCSGTGEFDSGQLRSIEGEAECYRCGAKVPMSFPMCPECGIEFE